MNDEQHITGLILAGGAGRRVGGVDKGLLPWRDTFLAAQVAQCLRPQVSDLLLSCNRNRTGYAGLADITVTDTRENYQGPLAGIEAAIPHTKGGILIVAPCDTPLLPPDLVERLVSALRAGDGRTQVSYARDGQRDHYLCAAIRTGILPGLPRFLDSGQRAVRHWYAQQRCCAVDFSDRAGCFENYNELD
jgi:molybdopterin-guanine dinucleotide biosynthesis protein A